MAGTRPVGVVADRQVRRLHPRPPWRGRGRRSRSAGSSRPIWNRATGPSNRPLPAVRVMAGGRQRQALEAAPGRADAEQGAARRSSASTASVREPRRELDAEQAGGAREVPLPQRVARRAGQSRVQHPRDLRPGGEPLGHAQAGLASAGPAGRPWCARRAAPASNRPGWHIGRAGARWCAHAPSAPRSATVMLPSSTSEWPATYLVSAWIDTSTPWVKGWKERMPQVLSISTASPLAWATAARAGMSCTSKRVAARALGIEHAGLRADQGRERAGRDLGVVVGGRDAHAREEGVAERARRAVDAVRHQAVIAGWRGRPAAAR